ncbi:MAG: hypothetical protein AAF492_17325, partial [Verrucomicrobiota bacterium]
VDVMVPTGEVSVILTNIASVESFGTEQTPADNITTNFIEAFGLVQLTLIDDTNGWGTIGGATSGLYLVSSMFDLFDVPENQKYGLDFWEVDGVNVGASNPLSLNLTMDTTIQLHMRELFVEVSADVRAVATNWNFDFDTGIMYSDLEICNVSTTDVHLIEPFWYAFPSNNTQFLLNVEGETNGIPYIDITQQATSAIPLVGNMNNSLDTNECIIITNVAWYQLQALPFEGVLFARFFADPPGEGGGDPAFWDSDGDGVLNFWEQQYGLNMNHAGDAGEDPDGDGETNYEEFRADTHPGDGTSFLRITGVAGSTSGSMIQWSGGEAVHQYLECAESPNGPWITIFTNPPPTAINETILHSAPPSPLRFYRIRVNERLPPSIEE